MNEAASTSTSKPSCNYGLKCYRRNPSHFAEFSHPDSHPMLKAPSKNVVPKRPNVSGFNGKDHEQSASPVFDACPAPKRSRSEVEVDQATTMSTTSTSKFDIDPYPRTSPFGFYLTAVPVLGKSGNVGCLALSQILRKDHQKLVGTIHFNFMIDLAWLLEQYEGDQGRNLPIDLVVGESGGTDFKSVLKEVTKLNLTNVALHQARITMPYGTHHTKMSLLLYSDSLRILISTANLIERDWDWKTQAVYLSPMLPKLSADAANDSSSFKSDLMMYLDQYGSVPEKWTQAVKEHNFSILQNVHLIGSVPGRHTGGSFNRWGHNKLRQTLRHNYDHRHSAPGQLIAQFSSIGSLGAKAENWLTGQFLTSLSASKSSVDNQKTSIFDKRLPSRRPSLSVVYPCVEDVRTSLEGYEGGGSLPYRSDVAAKQAYLRDYMYRWVADNTIRTRAVPHIKTYVRLPPEADQSVDWFLVTSANLSKAAWGELQKNDSQICIRSYELGVLFLPNDDGLVPLPRAHFLPYDYPLTKYRAEDEPWVADGKYLIPDSHGRCTH